MLVNSPLVKILHLQQVTRPANHVVFPVVASPLCARISDGSVAFSAGAMSKIVSGKIFHRLTTYPLFFFVNIDDMGESKKTSGICSLTVTWSC